VDNLYRGKSGIPGVSATVSPASTMVQVGETKELRALPRDRSRRRVEHDLTFQWQIVEGAGALAGMHNQTVTFLAPGGLLCRNFGICSEPRSMDKR
jgi:hypothetical protein